MPNIYFSYKALDAETYVKLDIKFKEICRDLLGLQDDDVLCYRGGYALNPDAMKSVVVDFEWYPRSDVTIQDNVGVALTKSLEAILSIQASQIEIQFHDINKGQYYIGGKRLA